MPPDRFPAQSDVELWNYYCRVKLSPFTKSCHEEIIKELAFHFWNNGFRTAYIEPYGSSVNGFGSDGCDLDMNLTFSSPDRKERLTKVKQVAKYLKSHHCVSNALAKGGRHPVVSFHFCHRDRQYECDISLSNDLAVANSQLLDTYSQIDEVVPALGVLVKEWAKTLGICGYPWPNSYTWTLMVIHYLQWRRILPYLQQLESHRNSHPIIKGKDGSCDVYFFRDIDNLKQYWQTADNHGTLTKLLWGFFDYFATYNYGGTITCWKRNDIQLFGVNHLRVRDPFITKKTLTHKLPNPMFNQIVHLIVNTNHIMQELCWSGSIFGMSGNHIMTKITFGAAV